MRRALLATLAAQKNEVHALVTIVLSLARMPINIAPQKAMICDDHAAVEETTIFWALVTGRINKNASIPQSRRQS